jgi:hypothetical protein
MDLRVYTKQTVLQPTEDGQEELVDNVIDLIPTFDTENPNNLLFVDTVEDRQETIQACSLVCIYQYGLDPLDLTDGVRWSEALLEEISPVILMADLTNAVADVSQNASVTFGTATDEYGESYMTYTIEVQE